MKSGSFDAYRAALQEYTRERVPLQWAMTQDNLGIAVDIKPLPEPPVLVSC